MRLPLSAAWAVAALLFGAATSSQAQLVLDPSAASPLACLQTQSPNNSPPAYPKNGERSKAVGHFRVRLSFDAKDKAPRVDVFYASGSAEMQADVVRYVSGYRLPCLTAGSPTVVATQEFQFEPDGRPVTWSHTREERPAELDVIGCFEDRNTLEGRSRLMPRAAMERGLQGTVLARLKFDAPDKPPELEVLFNGGSDLFSDAVQKMVDAYRLPCLTASGPTVIALQRFAFRIEGSSSYVFKDLTLRQFLGSVEKLDEHKVRFDLNTMACPFDVKVTLYQPYLPNAVGEVGTPDANRREFLEWLKTLPLALSRKQLQQVLGDTINVTVPCGTIDLT